MQRGLTDRALVTQLRRLAEQTTPQSQALLRKESGGHIYKHLMNGVSHMQEVFVVAGGVLTLQFPLGALLLQLPLHLTTTTAAMLRSSAALQWAYMVPVLSACESIGKRPALVPGFLFRHDCYPRSSINPNTGMIDAGGAGVGFGFLGGIIW